VHGSPPVAAYCDRAAETITRRIEFTSCIGIVSFPPATSASIAAFYDSQKGLCQRSFIACFRYPRRNG